MYWLLIFSDSFIIFFATNVYNSTTNLLVWENMLLYPLVGSQHMIAGFLGFPPLISPNVNKISLYTKSNLNNSKGLKHSSSSCHLFIYSLTTHSQQHENHHRRESLVFTAKCHTPQIAGLGKGGHIYFQILFPYECKLSSTGYYKILGIPPGAIQ